MGSGQSATTSSLYAPYHHSKILIVVLESHQAILVDLRRRKSTPTSNGHPNGASTSKESESSAVPEVRHELKWSADGSEEAQR